MTKRSDPAIKTAGVFTALALGFACVYWAAVVLRAPGVLPFSMEHEGFGRASLPGSIVWLVFSNFGPALAAVIAIARLSRPIGARRSRAQRRALARAAVALPRRVVRHLDQCRES